MLFTIYHYNNRNGQVEKEEVDVADRTAACNIGRGKYGSNLYFKVFHSDISNAFIWPLTKEQFNGMIE